MGVGKGGDREGDTFDLQKLTVIFQATIVNIWDREGHRVNEQRLGSVHSVHFMKVFRMIGISPTEKTTIFLVVSCTT